MKQLEAYTFRLLSLPLTLLSIHFVTTVACAAPQDATLGASIPGNIPIQKTAIDWMTNCEKANPDAEYFIPESFSLKMMPSSSGAYGYRSMVTSCPLWIVDFSMNSKSNTYIEPTTGERIKESTVFSAGAYDLPSSASKNENGTIPTVAEDCKRYDHEYYIYSKMKHESIFQFQQYQRWKGSWNPSSKKCDFVWGGTGNFSPSALKFKAPSANVLVIRVMVRVKLRDSWQKASANAYDAPPE